MLNVTAFFLIVLWLVGIMADYQYGGSIHILLLAGIVIFIFKNTKKPRHSQHFENSKLVSLTSAHAEMSEDATNKSRR